MSLAYPVPRGTRQLVPDYVCDGVTTLFAVPFRFLDPLDVAILVLTPGAQNFALLRPNIDYTLSGVGVQTGGVATLAIPPGAGSLLRVLGKRIGNRLTSVVNDGAVQSRPVEDELDAIEMTLQELRRDVEAYLARSIRQPDADTSPLQPLALAAARANGGLAFDASGQPISGALPSIPVSTAMTAVFQAASIALARAALGLGLAALKGVTDNTQANLASAKGAFAAGNVLAAADAAGTVVDGGASAAAVAAAVGLYPAGTVFGNAGLVAALPAPIALASISNTAISPQRVRAVPAGFSAFLGPALGGGDVFPISVDGYGIGRVTPSLTPAQKFRSSIEVLGGQNGIPNRTIVWVDPVLGLDTNAGTQAAPFKTLNQAMTVSTAFYVYLMPGVHAPCEFSGATAVQTLKHVRALGYVKIQVPGQDLSSLTWTTSNGGVYYSATLTLSGSATVQRLLNLQKVDKYGQPDRVPQFANPAALAAAGYGWYISGTTISIAFLGLNVDAYKARFQALYLDSNGNARQSCFGAVKVMWEGDIDFYGVGLIGLNIGTSAPVICGDGATARFAAGYGYQMTGAYSYFSRSRAYANLFDGFNYTPGGTMPSLCIEHDVVSIANGDIATYGTGIPQNRQGSSAEIGASVIRMGGIHRDNWGQGIADVGGGGNNFADVSWLIGVDTAAQGPPSPTGVQCAANPGAGSRTMWCDTCNISSEQYSLLVSGAAGAVATLKQFNCITSASAVAPLAQAGGILVNYTPDAP